MDESIAHITIEMSDLEELAKINPLAWKQLLHIADNRILKGRIAALENGHVDIDRAA